MNSEQLENIRTAMSFRLWDETGDVWVVCVCDRDGKVYLMASDGIQLCATKDIVDFTEVPRDLYFRSGWEAFIPDENNGVH